MRNALTCLSSCMIIHGGWLANPSTPPGSVPGTTGEELKRAFMALTVYYKLVLRVFIHNLETSI